MTGIEEVILLELGTLALEKVYEEGKQYFFGKSKPKGTFTKKDKSKSMPNNRKNYQTPVFNPQFNGQQNQNNNPHYRGYSRGPSQYAPPQMEHYWGFDNEFRGYKGNRGKKNKNNSKPKTNKTNAENPNAKAIVPFRPKGLNHLSPAQKEILINEKMKSKSNFDIIHEKELLALKPKRLKDDKDEKAEIKKDVEEEIRGTIPQKQYTLKFSNNVDYSGIIEPLTDMSLGSGATQRNSQVVTISSIHIRGLIINTASTQNVSGVRIIVFKWNDNSDPTNHIQDILPFATFAQAPYSSYNINYEPLIQVLHDKLVMNSESSDQGQIINEKIKMDHRVVYGTGSPITMYGGIYLLALSSLNTDYPIFQWSFDTRFFDS